MNEIKPVAWLMQLRSGIGNVLCTNDQEEAAKQMLDVEVLVTPLIKASDIDVGALKAAVACLELSAAQASHIIDNKVANVYLAETKKHIGSLKLLVEACEK